ncbi:hypothetical protein ACF3OE_06545 [Capnocytophaga canis]|uniref:hypothetical protein n=1 Tax=Capnocytophaga TaxID=1016 RepID=UPI000BB1790D|nr:hypothetical protein [Capnocytophaga sp. H2931]ATA75227.1 hypothetical protein CGC52_07265 [Capnocytophaga sp. H2931]
MLDIEAYDFIEGIDALILAYFGKNPKGMETQEYIDHFRAIDFKMKCESRLAYNAHKRALVEVLNEFFSQTSQTNPE